MLYLSKGMILRQSHAEGLQVTHCGADYILTGIGAALWLGGRFGPGKTQDARFR